MHKAAFLTGYMDKRAYDEADRRANAVKTALAAGGITSLLAASMLAATGKGVGPALSGAVGLGSIGGAIAGGTSYANNPAEDVKKEEADKELIKTVSDAR